MYSLLSVPTLYRATYSEPVITIDGECSLTRSFTINSDELVKQVVWNFGDGKSKSGINTTHNYTTPALYNVVVNVEYTDGATDVFTKEITINQKLKPLVILQND